MIRWEQKRPSEVRPYTHDWSPFLGSDTIVSQVVTPTNITVDAESISADGKSTTLILSGGAEGTVGRIEQTITTAGGQTETEFFSLPIMVDEPVSLAEARAHARALDNADDNALLVSYIKTARIYVEKQSGWILLRRSFQQYFDHWSGYIELDKRPVVSVQSVIYHDVNDTQQLLSDYVLRLGSGASRIYAPSGGFPVLGQNRQAMVVYTAGFEEGSIADELELGRQAILMLVAHWYSYREAGSDRVVHDVPFAVDAIIERFRVPVA